MSKKSQHGITEEEKGLAFYFIFTLGLRKANSLRIPHYLNFKSFFEHKRNLKKKRINTHSHIHTLNRFSP